MSPDRPAGPALRLEDLRYGYESGSTVLDIEALRVERGERIMIQGASGSGKSTLLGLIAGVIDVRGGSLEVLGRNLAAMSGRQRDRFRAGHVGYIFQMFNLIPYLGVAENMALPCRLSERRRARLQDQSIESAVEALAERLGIAGLLDRSVSRLSVGQQQRVAAGRALIGAPELVLADEPTSALDVDHRTRFLDLLFEQCEQAGAALIFVSHDPQLAGRFDRIVSMTDINRAPAAS